MRFPATNPPSHFFPLRRSHPSPPTVLRSHPTEGGFGAGFRRNTFGFSTPSHFLSLRRSHPSPPTASRSLPTLWRIRSGLSTEYVRLLWTLSLSFSSSVSSDCVALASDGMAASEQTFYVLQLASKERSKKDSACFSSCGDSLRLTQIFITGRPHMVASNLLATHPVTRLVPSASACSTFSCTNPELCD
jgi:hypothetical protein